MHNPNSPRALLGVALLAFCASPRAEEETLTVVGKRSQHEEVATATRTATPAKLVPQTIESASASELTAYGQPTLSEALTGIPGSTPAVTLASTASISVASTPATTSTSTACGTTCSTPATLAI